MQNQQDIFESIFKRGLTDPGNAAFLQQLTTDHPYFSPAQFFLLQQTEEGSEAFNKQAAKTALFFNNPYWLNFQLYHANGIVVPEEPVIAHTIPAAEEIIADEAHQEPEAIETIITDEPTGHVTEEIKAVEEMAQPPVPAIETVITGEPMENAVEEIKPVEEIMPPLAVPIVEAAISMSQEEIVTPEKTAAKPTQEKNIMDEMPLFEPMHMVDYFASQGIKLSEEAQTADKLGKQLKSFTEWLKTMKKVHVDNRQVAGQSDVSIQSLAEKSNTEDEVLTEAMADVLARQGKTDKAREVLEKLSLLNPAKSAYFAAKIESLNKS